MAAKHKNKINIAAYEMLLTLLCQRRSNSWGWFRPVADPAQAIIDVVTNSVAFGDRFIRLITRRLREFVKLERLRSPLSPLVCPAQQLYRVLHIKASCMNIPGKLTGKDILIWDSGRGSRMGKLLKGGKSKGEVDMFGNYKLFHFAAGAAKWLVDTLRDIGKDYCAFVASDQIVCFSHVVKVELMSVLDVACAQDADLIFFDGPPELSIVRLHYFLDPKSRPCEDSKLALARDRTLLELFGGAHIFQCVLLKKNLLEPLATTLQAILQAIRDGYDLDFGVFDVTVMPQFVRPKWLKKEQHPAAIKIFSALCDLGVKVDRTFPVSVPIQVFNVNEPLVLKRLQKRIIRNSSSQRSYNYVPSIAASTI